MSYSDYSRAPNRPLPKIPEEEVDGHQNNLNFAWPFFVFPDFMGMSTPCTNGSDLSQSQPAVPRRRSSTPGLGSRANANHAHRNSWHGDYVYSVNGGGFYGDGGGNGNNNYALDGDDLSQHQDYYGGADNSNTGQRSKGGSGGNGDLMWTILRILTILGFIVLVFSVVYGVTHYFCGTLLEESNIAVGIEMDMAKVCANQPQLPHKDWTGQDYCSGLCSDLKFAQECRAELENLAKATNKFFSLKKKSSRNFQ